MPLKGTIKGGSVIFACFEHPKEIANKIAVTNHQTSGVLLVPVGTLPRR